MNTLREVLTHMRAGRWREAYKAPCARIGAWALPALVTHWPSPAFMRRGVKRGIAQEVRK